MKIEHSPKELYDKAVFHYDNKQYDNLLETCALLLNDFHDSKEAVWAVNNFLIPWDDVYDKLTDEAKELISETRVKVVTKKRLKGIISIICSITAFVIFPLLFTDNIRNTTLFSHLYMLSNIFAISGIIFGYSGLGKPRNYLAYIGFFLGISYLLIYVISGILMSFVKI